MMRLMLVAFILVAQRPWDFYASRPWDLEDFDKPLEATSAGLPSSMMQGDLQTIALTSSKLIALHRDAHNTSQRTEPIWDDGATQSESSAGDGDNATSSTDDSVKVVESTMIGWQWKKGKMLGQGSYGSIWEGSSTDGRVQHPVSIKMELSSAKQRALDKEAKMLVDLQGPGIPKFYQYMENAGMPDGQRYLAMEKLGLNLEQYRSKCGGRLSEAVVMRLAYQMVQRFQHVHTTNHGLYRDTKPNNFMLGWDPVGQKYTNTVYLIDFGLCSTYWDSLWKMHLPQMGPKNEKGTARLAGFVGTQRYASSNALSRYQQSRRDDMETLGYVWSHLFTGAVPWAGMPSPDTCTWHFADGKTRGSQDRCCPTNSDRCKAQSKRELFWRGRKKRRDASQKDWTYSRKSDAGEQETVQMLPDVLKGYMKDVMSLDHSQEPHYDKYLSDIENAAGDKGIDLNGGLVNPDGSLICE